MTLRPSVPPEGKTPPHSSPHFAPSRAPPRAANSKNIRHDNFPVLPRRPERDGPAPGERVPCEATGSGAPIETPPQPAAHKTHSNERWPVPAGRARKKFKRFHFYTVSFRASQRRRKHRRQQRIYEPHTPRPLISLCQNDCRSRPRAAAAFSVSPVPQARFSP